MKKNVSSKNLQSLYQNLDKLESDFRNNNLYHLILCQIKGKTLLDIGAGVGHFVNKAVKKGLKAVGIEYDKELISLGKKIYGNKLEVKNMDIEDIENITLKFENITMIDVLEHIKDDEKILIKIKSKLEESGRLIILVPANNYLYSKRDKNIGHYRRYSKNQLKSKLEKAGYKIIKIRYWNMLGFFPYLIFEKILNKRISSELRTSKKKGVLKKTIQYLINLWLKYVEHNINLGFGLSLLCVVEKK